MKKIIGTMAFIAALVLAGCGKVTTAADPQQTTTAPPSQEQTTTTTPVDINPDDFIWGDANCDTNVSISDAVAILQSIGNKDKYELKTQGALNADCCDPGDGVTARDALSIQKLDAGAIKELPEFTTKA